MIPPALSPPQPEHYKNSKDGKGDVRNEYVRPIKWKKPGVLVLEQNSILRGGEGDDAKLQLVAGLDSKSGKFKVVSKKKMRSDVKKED